MSTQSILFYGVFVKTAYLCFASDAFKKIKGSLLGIDLICARRRQGNLSTTEGHEGVKRVPEEVWKMIKAEVGGIAVFEAERKFVGGYADYDMWDSEEEYGAACKWNGDMMSEWALQAFFTKGGMGEMLRSRSEEVKVLLQPYGLVLPFSQQAGHDESFDYDLNCLSAISLPLLSTGSPSATQPFPSVSLERSASYGSERQAVKYSKQTFAISPSADHRIKSFLSLFRLQAVSYEMETVHPPQHIKTETPASQAKESKTVEKKGSKTVEKKGVEAARQAAHKAVCCDKPDLEPHWHMWAISQFY